MYSDLPEPVRGGGAGIQPRPAWIQGPGASPLLHHCADWWWTHQRVQAGLGGEWHGCKNPVPLVEKAVSPRILVSTKLMPYTRRSPRACLGGPSSWRQSCPGLGPSFSWLKARGPYSATGDAENPGQYLLVVLLMINRRESLNKYNNGKKRGARCLQLN